MEIEPLLLIQCSVCYLPTSAFYKLKLATKPFVFVDAMERSFTGSYFVNLRHLRSFEIIAQLENFSEAARALNISQPALTQAIKRLETQFDVTLFERGSRGSFLTDHGSILRDRVSRLLRQLEGALAEALIGSGAVPPALARQLADRITMTQVRALIAIEQQGSLVAASRVLGVSAAALHRCAHDMESLGRRAIFRRTSDGVRTTRSGAELARRLQIMLRELDYAAEELGTAKGHARARIDIGIMPFSRASLLAKVINTLMEEFPDTRIHITEGVYDLLLSMLRSGRIDFLYGVLRSPDGASDILEHPLFHDPYAIVVRRGHPLTKCKEISLKQLAAFDWIVGGPQAIRRMAFEQMFAELDYLPRTSIEATSLKAVRALLSTSDRITLLTRMEIEFEERLGVLTTVDYDPGVRRNIDGIVTRANCHPTPVQEKFIYLMRRISSKEIE